ENGKAERELKLTAFKAIKAENLGEELESSEEEFDEFEEFEEVEDTDEEGVFEEEPEEDKIE
ncbi:MAG TPA: hypothetical protein VN278_06160, partial [Methanosarcina sp.]|nr:hypothetical protein [Methanosarcina sp.]